MAIAVNVNSTYTIPLCFTQPWGISVVDSKIGSGFPFPISRNVFL
jgi:hypothetical protein